MPSERREARRAKRQERRSKPSGRLAKKASQLNWTRITKAIGKAREAGVDFSPKLQAKIQKKISRKPGGKLV
jgi:hypothetical protein